MTDRVEQEASPSAALDRAWDTEVPGRAAGNGAHTESPAQRPSAMDEIDREVKAAMAAMAAMDASDLAELSGHVPVSRSSDSTEPGTELVGTVVTVTNDEIFLEFGPKTQGIMPRNHFGKKEPVEPGRRVDCIVDRFDSESGLLIVSRKGAAQRATWSNLQAGMLVEGRVTGVIKGGLEIDLKGIRAFMPASHVDVHPMKDISLLLNQVVQAEVLEVDRRHKNVLLSRRKAMEKEREQLKEKLRGELEAGQRRKGVVKTIVEYGAFVDLGGIDGLLHIRDLSYGSVGKVEDVLSVGQEVEVLILKIDKNRERISLGFKQAKPDPWGGVAEKYPVGNKLKARVVRLADFGAFAELEPGVEGLIPISEMGWNRIHKPTEAVSEGSVVDCVVIRVEPERRRLALSMKQTQADPWAGVFESYPEQSLVTGKVTRLAPFGVFVELAPGVEGLVHISELADRHVKNCSEVVQPGQEVQARVIGVDRENHRIGLSIKAVNVPSMDEMAYEPAQKKEPKKRKKPLRGGLASHFEW